MREPVGNNFFRGILSFRIFCYVCSYHSQKKGSALLLKTFYNTITYRFPHKLVLSCSFFKRETRQGRKCCCAKLSFKPYMLVVIFFHPSLNVANNFIGVFIYVLARVAKNLKTQLLKFTVNISVSLCLLFRPLVIGVSVSVHT